MTDAVDTQPVDDDMDDDDGAAVDAPRRGRTALVACLVLAVVIGGLIAVLGTREPATDRQAKSPLVGKAVPDLAGETLTGGSFDIDDHRGRWVVVNFFATWCPPCIVEHPDLVSFDQEHRQAGDAVLVSVLFDDDVARAEDFFEDRGGDWPVVLDGDGLIATDFGVPKVPETYLVDPDGRVVAKITSGVTQAGLEQIIEEFS